MTDTPYGVTGCRCYHVTTMTGRTLGRTWKTNPACPEHGDNPTVTVPATGHWLVIDGKTYEFEFDTKGYAGPQVHLIVTKEPIEDDD